MNTVILDGALFARMVKNGAENLNRNRMAVNDLNVFPVPDGDTGDNMFMTIDSGTSAAEKFTEEGPEVPNLGQIAGVIARGMLLGARGNSGVILSRIFAGIAKSLEGVKEADLRILSEAFRTGIGESYQAVSKPVEGTILSVYRDAVNYAADRLHDGSTLETFFDDLIFELRQALNRTPELLAVLKDAGVVDSGGAGFVYIAEGMQKALSGELLERKNGETRRETVDLNGFSAADELKYGYCTEVLLRLQDRKLAQTEFTIQALTEFLNAVGNSVVCFREDSIVKVHVHTMTPGAVLDKLQEYGEFLTLKIENMNLQHHEEFNKEQEEAAFRRRPHKKYGIVTVASGEGIKSLFTELGADEVIDGGPSMNPAAADFVAAFRKIPAETIFVLPNNGNVILAAKQAAALYPKVPVVILETRTVGEGYAVLSMFDTNAPDAAEIEAAAKEAIEGTVTGVVAKANRTAGMDGIAVKEGDFIGFTDEKILVDDGDRNDTAMQLLEKLSAEDADIVMLISGAAVPAEQVKQLEEQAAARFKNADVIPVSGGQPLYDYILVLE